MIVTMEIEEYNKLMLHIKNLEDYQEYKYPLPVGDEAFRAIKQREYIELIKDKGRLDWLDSGKFTYGYYSDPLTRSEIDDMMIGNEVEK